MPSETAIPGPHNAKRQLLTAAICTIAAVASPVVLSMVVEGEVSDHAARAAVRIAGIVAVIIVAAYLLFWRVGRQGAAALMLGVLAPVAAALVLTIAIAPDTAGRLLAMAISAKLEDQGDQKGSWRDDPIVGQIPDGRVSPERLAAVEKCAIDVKLTAIHQVNQIKAFWSGRHYTAQKLKHDARGVWTAVLTRANASSEFSRAMPVEYTRCFFSERPGERSENQVDAAVGAIVESRRSSEYGPAMAQLLQAVRELEQQTRKVLDLLEAHSRNTSIVQGKLSVPGGTVNAELAMRLTRIDDLRAQEEAAATNLLLAIDKELNAIRERAKPKPRPSAT